MLFRPRARTTGTDSRGLRRRSRRRWWYNAFFVPSAPTKTAAAQRDSQRAERAINTEREARGG
jgi:hypothetical protein